MAEPTSIGSDAALLVRFGKGRGRRVYMIPYQVLGNYKISDPAKQSELDKIFKTANTRGEAVLVSVIFGGDSAFSP